MEAKKHKKSKKHKSDRKSKYDDMKMNRPPSLKLILKVGGTPEHGTVDSPAQYERIHNEFSGDFAEKHKKSKKKKKKKEKDREKKHKRNKEKRHKGNNSSQEDLSMEEGEESSQINENFTSIHPSANISSTPLMSFVTKPLIPMKIIETPLSYHNLQSVQDQNVLSPESNYRQMMDTKMSESPKTPSSIDSNIREPRTCVLKLKQSRSPLAKVLDHLLKTLEKRDPHQFFAWPVTDTIAPGYSSIITKPMDFSTMRQKIEDCEYPTVTDFIADFKLMCDNAINYNHAETVYHKAAKRLVHVGIRSLQPDNVIRTLRPLQAYMKELSAKELGFDLATSMENQEHECHVDSADEAMMTSAAEENILAQIEEEEKRKQIKINNDPKTHFEPFVDNLTSDEILEQAKNAGKIAQQNLRNKGVANRMGFLRQNRDGTTSMQILVSNENNAPERLPTLGSFTGKLQQGTGQLQGFREDRRNSVKMVKNLNYGAFSSFAPVFDSRFSNLNKNETEMIMNTYGDEVGSQYAESITKFSKDSGYASTLANRLLDLLSCGEHTKTMETLMENNYIKESQKEIEDFLPDYRQQAKDLENVQVDFGKLRSLSDLGLDVNFIDQLEQEIKLKDDDLVDHLKINSTLINRLHILQQNRLSAPLPSHLSHVQRPESGELQLADQITTNFTDIAKKLPPNAIATAHGIRKAIGVSNVGLEGFAGLMNKNRSNEVDTTPIDMELEPETTSTGTHMDIDNELRELLSG